MNAACSPTSVAVGLGLLEPLCLGWKHWTLGHCSCRACASFSGSVQEGQSLCS